MDAALRALERQAQTGDKAAIDAFLVQLKRVNKFVLLPGASKRIKLRWQAHNAGACQSGCKFCRKGIPREP